MKFETKVIAVASSTLALSLAGAAAMAQTSVDEWAALDQDGMERCYGVALAGENDCSSSPGGSCHGWSITDYQGDAWSYVPEGTCELIETPNGHGSLTPIDG